MAQPLAGPITVLPEGGDSFDFGGFGVEWKISSSLTEARFSIVHHPLAPHALAAPLHYHHNEDELSYVLRGTLGALLGDDVVRAEAGTWVFKPRHQWHTFWNDGDSPCEIISRRQGSSSIFARWPPPGATWGSSPRSTGSTRST